ncbi:MAG: SpoIIE family protein phosphatase [Bacteroidales bacterium]|nr:SpoIIE family protein phosphatase [Bacteroidales bacterium]
MTISVIIISICLVAAVGYILYNRKINNGRITELKAESEALKKEITELKTQNEANEKRQKENAELLETRDCEIECLKGQLQQMESNSDKTQKKLTELRNMVDTNKMRKGDMLKHLLALQKTMMTEANIIKSMFSDFFVLCKPAETVGGDFYKFIKKGDTTIVFCGNCGMSGINGLIKGLVNIVFVQEIIEKSDPKTLQAGYLLDMLRSKYAHLAEKNDQYRGDEDIPVNFTACVINEKEHSMTYAGAYGSICLLRKSYPGTSRKENDLHEFRGDRMNFAVSFGRRKNYTSEFVELEKDDKIYLKTDGFVNQRGGANNDRFGDQYLRQMLMKNANNPMLEQKSAYEEEFVNWRGGNKPNDILLIGLALKVSGK